MPRQITSRKPRKEFLLPRKRIVIRECSEDFAKRLVVHLLALRQNDHFCTEPDKDVDELRIAGGARFIPRQTGLVVVGRVVRGGLEKVSNGSWLTVRLLLDMLMQVGWSWTAFVNSASRQGQIRAASSSAGIQFLSDLLSSGEREEKAVSC